MSAQTPEVLFVSDCMADAQKRPASSILSSDCDKKKVKKGNRTFRQSPDKIEISSNGVVQLVMEPDEVRFAYRNT